MIYGIIASQHRLLLDGYPSAPNNITVSNIQETSVFVDWADSTDDVGISGYNIYLTGGIYNNTKVNGGTLIGVSQYSLTGLSAGITYDFTIQAVDTDDNATMSVSTEFTTDGVAVNNPPTSLSTEYGYTWADLSWSHHVDGMPDTYRIYRDGVQVGSVSGSTTLFEDYDLNPGQSYSYTVRSVRNGQESANSPAHARELDTPAVTGDRHATAQDALRIKNANVGDGLKVGSNWGISQLQNNEFRGFQYNLGPGQKLLIKGGEYEFIWFNLPDVIGTKENPVIITNYEGQVILKKGTDTGAPLKDRFACFGMQNFKVTGKYVEGVSGDKRYQGHDGLWGYSFLHGTYGFTMDGNWEEGTAAFKGNQTYFEAEYTEICNGHFAGFSLKRDESASPDMDINIHDNLVRDLFSEAFYVGKNVTNCAQHGIKGKIYNNLLVRPGTESLQISNITNRVDVYNNTLIMSSCNWKNAFQDNQNNANQFGVKQGVFVYKGNLIWGSAKKHLDIGIVDNECNPPDANKPVLIAQNTFAFSRGRSVYLFNNTDLITPLIFDDNDFHLVDTHTGEMYINENLTDIIRNDRDDAPVHVTNNRYTSGKTLVAGNAATVNTNNTTYTFQWAQFEGSGFGAQFNPLQYEMWAEKMGSNPQFNSQGTTYQTTPMNSSGSVDISTIVEDQVIQIGYYTIVEGEPTFVNDFPQRFGVDFWNTLATAGIDLRLSDPNNEYDNFAIVTLKSVNLTNNTITVSAPITTRGTYNGQLLIDKDLAYIFYNYDPDPDLRDIVGYHGKFYRYKFSGSRFDYKGEAPDLDDGTFWEELTWERPDGTISYLPEDNWKIANTDPYYAPRLQGIGYTVELPDYASPPDGVIATTISDTEIELAWNASEGATGYQIERRPEGGVFAVIADNDPGFTYLDDSLTADTAYEYRVSAINIVGIGDPSVIVSATTELGEGFYLKVEAEDFDAQSGTSVANDGTEGDYVSSIQPGDFVEYEINIPSAGTYDLIFRVSSPLGTTFTKELEILIDDVSKGRIRFTTEISPGVWATKSISTNGVSGFTSIALNSGVQTLKIAGFTNQTYLGWFEIVGEGGQGEEPTPTENTYYVDPSHGSSSDSNDGTESLPWDTITRANTVAAGSTVIIKAGTYNQVIQPTNNGTVTDPITFKAYYDGSNYDQVIITGGSGPQLQNRSYIIVEGIEIDTTSNWANLSGGNHNRLYKCIFYVSVGKTYNNWSGITMTNNTTYNTIEACEFTGEQNGPHDLIYVRGGSFNKFQGNKFIGGTHQSLYLVGDTDTTDYCVVINNEIQNKWHTGNSVFKNVNNALVEGNIVKDCGEDHAINFSGSQRDRDLARSRHPGTQSCGDNNIFRGNVWVSNGEGLSANPAGEFPCKNSRVYRNTFVENYRGFRINSAGDSSGTTLKNNIFKDNIEYQVNTEYGSADYTCFVKSNCFHGAAGLKIHGHNGKSITQLETDIPSEFANNLSADPLFVDQVNRDYTLQGTSPCIDAGEFETTTTSAGSGTVIPVADAKYFVSPVAYGGIIEGDLIQLEGQSTTARIVSISGNNITVDTSLTWTNGQGLGLAYTGTAPNIGADQITI